MTGVQTCALPISLSWGGSPPLLLALGSFDPDDVLSARTASSPEALDGKPCSAAYDYTIKGMDPAETVTLRIRTDAPERSQAALLIDGSWVLQNCTVDGSYLVLTAPAEGSVSVFTAPPSILPILFSVLGGVASLALIVLYLRRRSVKRKEEDLCRLRRRRSPLRPGCGGGDRAR